VTRNYDVPGPVTARLDGQGQLQPGTEGYWPVHGARATDIRPGDLVMAGWKDRDNPEIIHHAEYEVTEMASFDAPAMNTIRVRFIATTGKFASVGMLQPIALARWGTHRTLAGSVR
jgi:hypothetical protein